MGGLRKYMPITYVTMVIGGLALCGIPPFAGFFSKDSIIEAVHLSSDPGARLRVLLRGGRRVRDGLLHVPADLHDVPRRASASDTSAASREHDAVSRRSDEHEHHGDPEGKPVGRDGAADPARDSVGGRRLDRHRAAALRRLLRQLDRRPSRARRAGQAQGGVARRRRVRSRTACHVAGSGIALAGIASAIYLYLFNPALPGAHRQGAGRRLHRARQQLLLRPLQRLVLRRRRAARSATSSATSATRRSSKASSTARRAWSAWWGVDAAADAVGLRLPLRVHDDHRTLRAAHLVGESG